MNSYQAAAHVAYAYTKTMAMDTITGIETTKNQRNIFGDYIEVAKLNPKTLCHVLSQGNLTTIFISAQELVFLIPNLYTLTGERLPCVIQASNIFGFREHSAVYASRQSGAMILCPSSVVEVMDLTPVAYGAAITGRNPCMLFFDGFQSIEKVQQLEPWKEDILQDLLSKEEIDKFNKEVLDEKYTSTKHPVFADFPDILQSYMDKVNKQLGTDYKLFNYYGVTDAEHVIIAMGSMCETIKLTLAYLIRIGKKVGLVQVHVYRPFSAQALIDTIPEKVKTISVLDIKEEPGSMNEPLYQDVISAGKGTQVENCLIRSGRCNLGSNDLTSEQITKIYNTKSQKFVIQKPSLEYPSGIKHLD